MSIALKNAHLLIDTLAKNGAPFFCICPGFRNTSLTLAVKKHPHIVHFDERGGAFFALGYAKATKRPCPVIVTSGTAVANLFPALMEAKQAQIPLILISADRPMELWECGSNQTAAQTNIFSLFTSWSASVDLSSRNMPARGVSSIAAFSLQKAREGPVHINALCREPFFADQAPTASPPVTYLAEEGSSSPKNLPYLSGKTLILLGEKRAHSPATFALAKKHHWPIFADILSNPYDPKTIKLGDILHALPDALPDNVLHFGERFVTKKLFHALEKAPPKFYAHISERAARFDPFHLITDHFVCKDADFCAQVRGSSDPSYLQYWEGNKAPTGRYTLQQHYLQVLGELLPKHWAMFLGNSTIIRDAGFAFSPKNPPILLGNRGCSGIDGNLATACGAAQALQMPLLAVMGDQAFLHDSNSCAFLQKTPVPVILLVFNNQGGQIFHTLGICKPKKVIDELFVAKHSFQFAGIADTFQLPYSSCHHVGEFPQTMKKIFDMKKSYFVEVQL